jgi:hypothetical protein
MKKIIMACAACWLCLFISCEKEITPQPTAKPKQQTLTDSLENNQVVTLAYSTGLTTLCPMSRFTLVTYAGTGESLLNIISCYQINILNPGGPGTYLFGTNNAPGTRTATMIATPFEFAVLPYDPGTITIESMDTHLVKGSIDARLYSTAEGIWEGVDTVFLRISGNFEAKLHRVDR